MKKFILPALIVFLTLGIFDYIYTSNKYKNLLYSVEHSLTTGIFNSHKLKSIDTFSISYKDENIAVVTVSGTKKNSTQKTVKYELLLKKNINKLWKVQNIYNLS
jgi:hypothetical protein